MKLYNVRLKAKNEFISCQVVGETVPHHNSTILTVYLKREYFVSRDAVVPPLDTHSPQQNSISLILGECSALWGEREGVTWCISVS